MTSPYREGDDRSPLSAPPAVPVKWRCYELSNPLNARRVTAQLASEAIRIANLIGTNGVSLHPSQVGAEQVEE